MRGFGSGVIWGGVVGALGLVVVSENTPLPRAAALPQVVAPAANTPEPPATSQAEPAAPDAVAPQPEAETQTSEAQPEPATEPVLEPADPSPAPEVADDAETVPQPAEAAVGETQPGQPDTASAIPDAEQGIAGAEEPSAVVAEAVEVPAGSEFSRALPDQELIVPEAPAALATAAAPAVAAPEPGQTLPATDTAPAVAPEPDMAAPAAPGQPEVDGALPELALAAREPSAPSAIVVPETPSTDVAPGMADLPPPPPLTPEEQALVDNAPEALPSSDEPAPDADASVSSGAEEALPTDEPLPDATQESESAVLPSDAPLAPIAPLPEAQTEDAGSRPALSGPATGFSGEVAGVVTNRLPRIGDAPAAGDGETVEAPKTAPIDRFARRFENPTGKPDFAIVLIDDGDPALDREKLAALPFPVTFALDPTLPNVGDLAATYRAAGQEVVMLATAIPEGATAADLEVTFAAHAAALPEAVAVMDLAQGGFQANRLLATQVVPVIKGQGRGLLTYDAGLNAADQVASREELRAATVFRRIDADGEPVGAIRRALDRAVFKASQTGRVAVVGEARPETVAALMEWSVEGRAAVVELAPVTAVMVTR